MITKCPASLCAAALAAALLLGGCGSAHAPASSASGPAPAASLEAGAASPAMQCTQGPAVPAGTYLGEKAFARYFELAQPDFYIPGLNEGVVPQGMDLCEANGTVYISNYYSTSGKASILTAVDLATGTLKAEYTLLTAGGLPFDGHVGGVAATDTTLYISGQKDQGRYTIYAVPLSALESQGSHTLALQEMVAVPVSPSFLSFSGGMLWVGNFYHPGGNYGLSDGVPYETATADGDFGCYILGYDLGADEAARLQPAGGAGYALPDVALIAPNKIQGMVCMEDGSVTLSQSYGRKNNAALLRYTLSLGEEYDTAIEIAGQSIPAYVLDSHRLAENVTALPMTEALCDTPEGEVLVLFESGSQHYSNGLFRTDRVWRVAFAQ